MWDLPILTPRNMIATSITAGIAVTFADANASSRCARNLPTKATCHVGSSGRRIAVRKIYRPKPPAALAG
jgi:hypothetical protein